MSPLGGPRRNRRRAAPSLGSQCGSQSRAALAAARVRREEPPDEATVPTRAGRSGTKHFCVGQRLLQVSQARVRDPGFPEVETVQALEFLQFLEAVVRDLGGAEAEPLQALKLLQVLQAGVRAPPRGLTNGERNLGWTSIARMGRPNDKSQLPPRLD